MNSASRAPRSRGDCRTVVPIWRLLERL